MKSKFVFLVVILSSTFAIASNKMQCLEYAENELIKYSEMSKEEFINENGLIYTCKQKTDLSKETIQYGDGSGLLGIEINIVNGECTTSEIYSGQDDGDQDISETLSYCTRESVLF